MKNCLVFSFTEVITLTSCMDNARYANGHGRRKEFFQGGGQQGIFPKVFPWGAKSGEIWFLPLEIEKTTLFANNFKIQGRPMPPLPTPMQMASHQRQRIIVW